MKSAYNHNQDYLRNANPLQNYYPNVDNAKSAQIKKVKSTEHLPHVKQTVAQQPKKPFIQPGTACDPFQEIISTTCLTENGQNTYFVAKALRGPALSFASQECLKKQQAKKPTKKIPEIPPAIKGTLGPHLESYSTITHEGMYRQSNEDKITIYLEDNAKWFSIYDGHGGSKCSQFLKDHLHEYFFKEDWKRDIPNALRKAFLTAESQWKKKGDNSGSCAVVIFIYENVCYAANLGDSRAILASESITKCYQITKDHKPSNPDQQKRIIQSGGKIYQTTAITETNGIYDMIVGPLRVFPGRLSTTRTFGDFQAKEKEGSKVISCQPEITSFEIDDHDLIVMGSDGIWDKIENKEVVQVMKGIHESGITGEEWYAKGAQQLLLQSMNRGSTDNVSLIVIGLNDPSQPRQPKKGNEHIKIFSSISNSLKKKNGSNKQNSYPDKMKELDSKISEINRNASRILQQGRK